MSSATAQTPSGDVIQCLVTHQAFWPTGASGPSSGGSTLYSANFSDSGGPSWDPATQLPRFWVLDRANPLAKPTSFVAVDPNTVPAGLQALMDGNHLLIVGILSDATRVPQGPLFDFLMANGSDAALSLMENLNTGMACGVRCMFAYTMVSVAGGNEGPGIEILTVPVPMDQQYTQVARSQALAPFQLIRGDSSGYYPVKNQI